MRYLIFLGLFSLLALAANETAHDDHANPPVRPTAENAELKEFAFPNESSLIAEMQTAVDKFLGIGAEDSSYRGMGEFGLPPEQLNLSSFPI